MPERCGARFRKPVETISDRAKRYRAHQPGCRPDGPKVCYKCGSRRFVVPDHIDGDESNGRKSNLRWACKRHNTIHGKAMAKAGRGVRTRQYNPYMSETFDKGSYRVVVWANSEAGPWHVQPYVNHGETWVSERGKFKRRELAVKKAKAWLAAQRNPGATNLAQYVQAAVDHTRGAHDAGGKVIHETPKVKRREFAREIAFRKGYRNPKKNPELPSSEKLSHAAVGYQTVSTHPGQSCASCVHLIAASPLRCQGVKSPINGPGWCKRFESAGASADKLYKQFHGRGPDKILNLLVQGIDPYGAHPALTSLGPLIRLVVGEDVEFDDDGVVTGAEWVNEISFIANGSGNRMSMESYRNLTARLDKRNAQDVRDFRSWLVSAGAPDVAAVPNTRQIYFLGGRQNLTSAELASLGCDPEKDICDLGECWMVEYFAQKRFDRNEPTTYFHEFGEESDVRPRLIFMRVPKLFLLAGGEYTVKPAGITN
jgi:hypothetical protein